MEMVTDGLNSPTSAFSRVDLMRWTFDDRVSYPSGQRMLLIAAAPGGGFLIMRDIACKTGQPASC
jgi:hypothetical protein